jgi:hypothetical protein
VVMYLLPFLPFVSGESRIRFPIDHIFLLNVAAMVYYGVTAKRVDCVCGDVPGGDDLVGAGRIGPWFSSLSLARARQNLTGLLHLRRAHLWVVIVAAAAVVLALSRVSLGVPNANRLLKLEGAQKVDRVSMDNFPPDTLAWEELLDWTSVDDIPGLYVDMECTVDNQEWPPLMVSADWLPEFAQEEEYRCYRARALSRRPLKPGEPKIPALPNPLLCFKGAAVEKGLREGDRVRVLGRFREFVVVDYTRVYVEVERAKKIE